MEALLTDLTICFPLKELILSPVWERISLLKAMGLHSLQAMKQLPTQSEASSNLDERPLVLQLVREALGTGGDVGQGVHLPIALAGLGPHVVL